MLQVGIRQCISISTSALVGCAVGAEFIRPSGIMSSSRLNAWLSLDLVQKEALEEGSQVESLFGQVGACAVFVMDRSGGRALVQWRRWLE